MIKTSIVIPSYKRINQTLQTIELLLSSSGINTEFKIELIVADASPDEELKKALENKFANKVIYVRPEKPGISTNKNTGAKKASHQILIFCDSDMEVEKNTIMNTITALKKHKTAAAIGGQVIWKGGPKDKTNDRPRKEDRMVIINETTYTEAIYSRYIVTYKDIFWEVGGYDEEVFNMRGEGSDLSVRYWRAGYPLVYDSSIIVHHIHEVDGGIIRNVPHPEWGIAKDLLLLAYKYNMSGDKYKNFMNTVAANFDITNKEGYFRILEGINKNLDFITKVKLIIDQQKIQMKNLYDFKFLEIFSDQKLFEESIKNAENKIKNIRQSIFI